MADEAMILERRTTCRVQPLRRPRSRCRRRSGPVLDLFARRVLGNRSNELGYRRQLPEGWKISGDSSETVWLCRAEPVPCSVPCYESFIYKSSSFKVSLPQCAQDSIAWESYVIMYINDINLSTSIFRCPDYLI